MTSIGPSRASHTTIGRQVPRFAAIGVISTAAYAGLYAVLRSVTSAAIANALALVVTAVANTAANRRLTFGVRGRNALVRDHLAGLAAFAVALVITTTAIGMLDIVAPQAGRVPELAVLLTANAAATVVRFVLLRAWIADDPRSASSSPSSIRLERTVP